MKTGIILAFLTHAKSKEIVHAGLGLIVKTNLVLPVQLKRQLVFVWFRGRVNSFPTSTTCHLLQHGSESDQGYPPPFPLS